MTASDVRAWAEVFFGHVDRGDADAIVALVAENCTMTVGNAEPVAGREAIHAMVRQFRTTITSLEHELVRMWSVPEGVVAELKVTYGRLDGSRVTLPCTNIFDIDEDGLVTGYQIFMDMSPVFG